MEVARVRYDTHAMLCYANAHPNIMPCDAVVPFFFLFRCPSFRTLMQMLIHIPIPIFAPLPTPLLTSRGAQNLR